MKAGIITFHRALNYGALLQAYGLKETLQFVGYDVFVIDYRNKMLEKMYEYPVFIKQRGLKNKVRYIFYSKNERKKRANFELFRNRYLALTDTAYTTNKALSVLNGVFDLFFTGSDQVWSPDAHDVDEAFFLGFVEDSSKKRSYAASFGVVEIRDELSAKYRQLLSDFEICSIREPEGVAIISKISPEKEIRQDIDPVFLVAKEKWVNDFVLKKTKKAYALIYSFSMDEYQKSMAIECCKQGLDVVIIGEAVKNPYNFPCLFAGDAGPVEFLQLLYGASFIITNSFHGAAMSLVLNRRFTLRMLDGGAAKANSRLTNLVKIFGLEDCVLNQDADCQRLFNQSFDWNHINLIIKEEKRKSVEYIEKCGEKI